MPILPAAVHKTRQPADWETLYGFRVRLVCDRPPDTRSYYSSSSLSLVIRFSLALRVVSKREATTIKTLASCSP